MAIKENYGTRSPWCNTGTISGVDAPKSNNMIRDIKIEQLDFGYIVSVGCKRFAISTKEDLLARLYNYINDPANTEEQYLNNR